MKPRTDPGMPPADRKEGDGDVFFPDTKKGSFISRTARFLVLCVVAVCIILLAAGLGVAKFFHPFESPSRFCLGLLLGGASSVLKVVLLDRSLNKTLDMEGEHAKALGRLHATARYMLTLVTVLTGVFFRSVFGVFGLIAGILSLQLGAYAASCFSLPLDPRR